MELDDLQLVLTDLSSPDALELVKIQADDVVYRNDISDAQDLLEVLSDVLARQGAVVERKNPQMYEQYETCWINVALVAFVAMDTQDQESILKTKILYAIQKGYDPSDLVHNMWDHFPLISTVKELFRTFAKDLEQNTEQLGAMPVLVEGKKFMPTIRYWILDYSRFPSQNAKRGNVERLNYVNQSQNTRPLTQVYRQQLLKVLKLYDDFLNAEQPRQVAPRSEAAEQRVVAAAQAAQPAPRPAVNIDQKLEELKNRQNNAS